ncbi:CRISPR-associated protein Cas4 [Vibrio sagamiensis]|uniref:CRISPR-associated exonuclease Cas4 n=1 Tax=Vibrio sagamiensis NBRC 104589 TaxID=1219064 RepID=A0A511QJT5_9VIBR|nr:CRISPR-associated protein Cas4 [Vibrio sagamiensis]PNQ58499.1 CRISPR-associated protein Cas4 [Vibrio agarivorans]GEM77598.1 CRISPR-associated protein Cas4 [Vibrio sagamiensis NBRC 104589]
MEYSDDLIPISHIRQYLFCPRVPWFKHVMQFEPPEQGWVAQGKRWHETHKSNHKRRFCNYLSPPTERTLNAYVVSTRLNIHGYIDELVTNGQQSVVIEYKVDSGKPTLAQKLQLIAYVVALEESTNKEVVAAILLKGKATKQYKVTVNDKLKHTLLEVLYALRKTIASHRMPNSSASLAQCEQCEYLRYCNDR